MKNSVNDWYDSLGKLGPHLLIFARVVMIVIASLIVERILRALVRRGYFRARAQDREDLTRYRFLKNAVRFIVGFCALVAVIYTIPSIKSLAVTLFAGAGILVAILGLAAQKAFSNIISGVFIVSFKPFRVGDYITIGTTAAGQPDRSGFVEDITLRHTIILTFENRRIIVPNAVISDEYIINSTIRDEATCEFVEVPVSYSTDLDLAMRVLQEVCVSHPAHMDRRTPKELEQREEVVPVRLVRMGDSSLVLRAYVWARDAVIARQMHYALNKLIVERFRAAGIEIPYPHRVMVTPAPPPVKASAHEKGQEA